MAEEDLVEDLELEAIIGYDGGTYNSLKLHPNKIHLIYPIGNAVVLQNRTTRKQEFLRGHTNIISCIALSNTGKYIASGQINHMGFKATTILWDFESRSILSKYDIHKVRVEYVLFTHEDKFMVSLGGRDDTCAVVFDVLENEPICGSFANSANTGLASILAKTSRRAECFITAGDRTIRIWRIDKKNRKIFPTEVKIGKLKRSIYCAVMDDKDLFCYCGTSSGDIAKIYMGYPSNASVLEPDKPPKFIGCFGKYIGQKKKTSTGASAKLYSQGVRCIILLGSNELIVGAGDGTVEWVRERNESHLNDDLKSKMKEPSLPMLIALKTHDVASGVSSMILDEDNLLVGTVLCEIFSIDMKTWSLQLKTTCHTSSIYDVAFPSDFSACFVTCSKDTLRVWRTETSQESLRIHVPNFTPSCVMFRHDGRAIVSSWNDGTIRAFTPLTGKLMFIIHNAHTKGVSAMAMTKDGRKIVSGGAEGQVRLWDIMPAQQSLIAVMGYQKGQISAVDINNADTEAVSASMDGSCIIWDIERAVRKTCVYGNTLFMTVKYHPSDCQLLTSGTDRKVAYWESFDGSLIREMEASTAAAVNALDFAPGGEVFASAGNDQIVKIWLFQKGIVTHVGVGHAAIITSVKFSPNGRYIISVSTDGAIYRWRNPYFVMEAHKQEPVKEEADIQCIHSEAGDTPQNIQNKDECVSEPDTKVCTCKTKICMCPVFKLPPNCKALIVQPIPRKTSSTESVSSKKSQKSLASRKSCLSVISEKRKQ